MINRNQHEQPRSEPLCATKLSLFGEQQLNLVLGLAKNACKYMFDLICILCQAIFIIGYYI